MGRRAPEDRDLGRRREMAAGCERIRRASRRRQRVFSNSLADFFDKDVPRDWRAAAWGIIAAAPSLDWYLVTKRLPNVAKMLPTWGWDQTTFGHVVIIITTVNQAEWDRDRPRLRALKDSFPWLRVGLSIEPLLGPIDLGDCAWLDWVIVGGESGGKARPAHPDWIRSLRDQCARADVPFHFKQWGEWGPGETCPDLKARPCASYWNGKWVYDRVKAGPSDDHVDDEPDAYRVGVKHTGRMLDGVVHDGFPRAVAA
jgi:protein gp37